MTKTKFNKQINEDQILRHGQSIIQNLELAPQRYYLDQYLRNHLRIYKTGVDVLDRKIMFYQDLNNGNPRALAMSRSILPDQKNCKAAVAKKIIELQEKKSEWIIIAETLPDKLIHFIDDDQEFKKNLHAINTLENSWYNNYACQLLGMCICEMYQYPPFQSSCLFGEKDFSILR